MKVYYDFEIELSTPIHGRIGIKYQFFNRVRELIQERLNILKDEIDQEELANESRAIIIKVKDPQSPSILFQGYSESLTKRMVESFENDYMIYIQQKVSEELGLSGLNFIN